MSVQQVFIKKVQLTFRNHFYPKNKSDGTKPKPVCSIAFFAIFVLSLCH